MTKDPRRQRTRRCRRRLARRLPLWRAWPLALALAVLLALGTVGVLLLLSRPAAPTLLPWSAVAASTPATAAASSPATTAPSVPAKEAAGSPDPAISGAQRKLAEKLYETTCAACHGPRGQGGGIPGMGIPPLDAGGTAWQKGDIDLQLIVRNGSGSMPGVGGSWTAADVRAVLDLIASWWTPQQRSRHAAAPGGAAAGRTVP